MTELITFPFKLVITILSVVLTSAQNILTFTINMVFTLITTLAPYAGAALLFASDEEETKATLVLEQSEIESKKHLVSTPKDGEWFSQFFAENQQIREMELKDGKMVIRLPKTKKQEEHFVYVNWYSLNTKEGRREFHGLKHDSSAKKSPL